MIDILPKELCLEVRNIVQELVEQNHPQEKEMQKRQNGCLRKP